MPAPLSEAPATPDNAGSPSPESQNQVRNEEHSFEQLTLPVLGMTCAACQHHVEEALRAQPGVQSARVDLMRHRASIAYSPQTIAPLQLVEAIRQSGYDAVLPRASSAAEHPDSNRDASSGLRATVTIAAGMLSMTLGMQPSPSLRWSLLILTTALAAWAGGSVYKSAWRALLHRETNMNTLVSLGTGVALIDSAVTTITNAHEAVYFDSV